MVFFEVVFLLVAVGAMLATVVVGRVVAALSLFTWWRCTW